MVWSLLFFSYLVSGSVGIRRQPEDWCNLIDHLVSSGQFECESADRSWLLRGRSSTVSDCSQTCVQVTGFVWVLS